MDDGGGDVGHDAQREDAQLEQRATGEDVDQAEEVLVLAGLTDAVLGVGQVDAGRRQDRPEPEQGHDAEGEEQLRPEVLAFGTPG